MIETWVGISAMILINIIGWAISFNRASKNEAKLMGAFEQKLKDICSRVDKLDERVDKVDIRVDKVILERGK